MGGTGLGGRSGNSVTTQRFWRWKDRPRADGGEDYTLEVNLWIWKGVER